MRKYIALILMAIIAITFTYSLSSFNETYQSKKSVEIEVPGISPTIVMEYDTRKGVGINRINGNNGLSSTNFYLFEGSYSDNKNNVLGGNIKSARRIKFDELDSILNSIKKGVYTVAYYDNFVNFGVRKESGIDYALIDIPYIDIKKSGVKAFNYAFYNAVSIENTSGAMWDVSNITEMIGTFSNSKSFNENIDGWNVRNVTKMKEMFINAGNFDGNLSKWNVINVSDVNRSTAYESFARGSDIKPFNYPEPWKPDNSPTIAMEYEWPQGNSGISNDIYIPISGGKPGTKVYVFWGSYEENKTKILNKDLSGVYSTDYKGNGINYYPTDGSPGTRYRTVVYYDEFSSLSLSGGTNNTLVDVPYYDVKKAKTTSFERAFWGAVNFVGNDNMSTWDTSNIESLMSTFSGAEKFNSDISGWNTSNVNDLNNFMTRAYMFQGDLSKWDTSKVTNMNGAFNSATLFNSDISRWDTSNVTGMDSMFMATDKFNSDISKWNTGKVTNMNNMFRATKAFNSNINDWNVSNVKEMFRMFEGALEFNSPMDKWNTRSLVNAHSMFNSTLKFNKPIGSWNMSSAQNISFMFSGAQAFNQDLNNWNTSNVTDMQGFLYGNKVYDYPITKWNMSKVVTMTRMFYNSNYNHDISMWNTSNVSSMNEMFQGATRFNYDLKNWNVDRVGDINYTNAEEKFAKNSSLNRFNFPQKWKPKPVSYLLFLDNMNPRMTETSNLYGFAYNTNLNLVAGVDYVMQSEGWISQAAKNSGKVLWSFIYEPNWEYTARTEITKVGVGINDRSWMTDTFSPKKTGRHSYGNYMGPDTTDRTGTVTIHNTILYQGKGGVWQPSYEGDYITLPQYGYFRTGFKAVGWKSNADGKVYSPGDKVQLTKYQTRFDLVMEPLRSYEITYSDGELPMQADVDIDIIDNELELEDILKGDNVDIDYNEDIVSIVYDGTEFIAGDGDIDPPDGRIVGHYVDNDGTVYMPGLSYKANRDITLTRVYIDTEYSVEGSE